MTRLRIILFHLAQACRGPETAMFAQELRDLRSDRGAS